jgi:hypothetical protein
MDSKKIITKLIKIANNQQKIIEKLAQQVADPNVEYLRRAVQQACANSGFKARTFNVTTTGGGSGTPDLNHPVTTTPIGYIVSMEGSPKDNALRQHFVDVLKKQVSTQKADQPDLVDNLTVLFQDN